MASVTSISKVQIGQLLVNLRMFHFASGWKGGGGGEKICMEQLDWVADPPHPYNNGDNTAYIFNVKNTYTNTLLSLRSKLNIVNDCKTGHSKTFSSFISVGSIIRNLQVSGKRSLHCVV